MCFLDPQMYLGITDFRWVSKWLSEFDQNASVPTLLKGLLVKSDVIAEEWD